MLKILRSEEDGITVFAVSGRIEEKDVAELGKLFDDEGGGNTRIALDLEEVRLVDRQVVRFLAACEARGIRLKNCPSFVREWIETGGDKR
jgi:hypothetical protein